MNLNLTLSIDKEDIKEIESSYDDLAGFLTKKYASFQAAAFVLNSIVTAVDKVKKQLD